MWRLKKKIRHAEKFYLVIFAEYNFLACPKDVFETPHEVVQCLTISKNVLPVHLKTTKWSQTLYLCE